MSDGKYILDSDGKPIPEHDAIKWEKWWRNIENRKVANTVLDDYSVSTVFLALDHNFSSEGPPLLYETMVFSRQGKEVPEEIECRRYSTCDEAMRGHQEMVLLLAQGATP